MSDHPSLPGGLGHLPRIREAIGRRRPAFFLDFDGTLAAIAPTPDEARMPPRMRELIAALAENNPVCVVSGRGLADLRKRVALQNVYYAGDHGHIIAGPPGSGIDLEVAPDDTLELEMASYELERRLRAFEGAIVEPKGVTLSVHYRLVTPGERSLVEEAVRQVAAASPGLRLTAGKLVLELTPNLGWNKGQAMVWLVKRLGFRRSSICPICLGDDRTDEDMFVAAHGWGISLVVGCAAVRSRADYCLLNPDEVHSFLEGFVTRGRYVAPARG